jgi:hypothetical protein
MESVNIKNEPEADFILILPNKPLMSAGTKGIKIKEEKDNKKSISKSQKKTVAKAFKCEKCPKSFGARGNLNQHMKSHNKPEQCNICEKRFATKNHLEIHLANHEDKRSFQCKFCVKNFNAKALLSNHVKHSHEIDKSKSKCGDCSFTSNPKEVRKHRAKVHLGRFCQTCDKTFVCKTRFEVHLNFHKNAENFTCKICGSKWESFKRLAHHLTQFHRESKSKFFVNFSLILSYRIVYQ